MERSHAAEGTQIESDIVILYTQFSISSIKNHEEYGKLWGKIGIINYTYIGNKKQEIS